MYDIYKETVLLWIGRFMGFEAYDGIWCLLILEFIGFEVYTFGICVLGFMGFEVYKFMEFEVFGVISY